MHPDHSLSYASRVVHRKTENQLNMLKTLLVLVAMCCAGVANAGWKLSTNGTCGTAAAAGSAFATSRTGSGGDGYNYFFTLTASNETTGLISGTYYAVSQTTGVQTGNSNWSFQTLSCVVSACAAKAGKPGITNWTVGYTRSPAEDDLNMVGSVNRLPANQMVCDSGCVVEMTSASAVWASLTPTDQGLYRNSIDFVSIPTGAACTPSPADAPANKTSPNPTCPGYVGEINGVKGCYGTASTPVTTAQADRPASPKQAGNPAAGEKPATGEGSGSTGSGRTPVAGTGGAAGGPASAAVAPKGTITKPAETEVQQECGAPGQPRCAIDESGTPSGVNALPTTQFEAKLQERQDALGTVTSSSGKDTTWGIIPQWTEGGVCTPWHIFTLPPALNSVSVDIDLCPYKTYSDGVANFIWVSLAIFAITSMVFAAMTSKGT